MKELNFHEKYYVGFKKDDEVDMLGFATQDTGDAAFEKRKTTVDGWRDKNIEPMTLENKPRTGFKIVNSVTRWSTSNKLFRVEDPMGFQLEISAANLFDVINTCTIVKGTIVENMVWGKNGQNHHLILSDSVEYKTHLKGPQKFELKPGMYLKNFLGNALYRYEGTFYKNLICIDHTMIDSGYRSYQRKYNVEISIVRDKKPFHVYSYWFLESDGDIMKRAKSISSVEDRRSPLPKLSPCDFKGEAETFFKTGVWLGTEYDNRVHSNVANGWTPNQYFATNEEAANAVYSEEEILELSRKHLQGTTEKITVKLS